jgi:hypothetical protein
MVLNMSSFSRRLALVSGKYIICVLLVGVVAACHRNSSNLATSGLMSKLFHAPFITATLPAAGADHAFQPGASDVQRDPLRFPIENKPIRTTIDPSSAKQELEAAYSLPTLVVVARRMPPRGPASSQ